MKLTNITEDMSSILKKMIKYNTKDVKNNPRYEAMYNEMIKLVEQGWDKYRLVDKFYVPTENYSLVLRLSTNAVRPNPPAFKDLPA